MKKSTFELLNYLTGVITGVPFTNPLEDMIQAKDVSHLMDHGVVMAHSTEVGRVQHHPTWQHKVHLLLLCRCFDLFW